MSSTQAQVGVQVKPGQIPAGGLNVGDTVQVLKLPDRNTAAAANSQSAPLATVLVEDATVFGSTPDPSQSGGTLLTLVVPRSDVAAIATASNASLIALVGVGQ